MSSALCHPMCPTTSLADFARGCSTSGAEHDVGPAPECWKGGSPSTVSGPSTFGHLDRVETVCAAASARGWIATRRLSKGATIHRSATDANCCGAVRARGPQPQSPRTHAGPTCVRGHSGGSTFADEEAARARRAGSEINLMRRRDKGLGFSELRPRHRA